MDTTTTATMPATETTCLAVIERIAAGKKNTGAVVNVDAGQPAPRPDPIRQEVEARQGPILKRTVRTGKGGGMVEDVSVETVPLAHYVARRERILFEADTGLLWQYDPTNGAWRSVGKEAAKTAADKVVLDLSRGEDSRVENLRNNGQLNNVAELVRMAGLVEGDPFEDRPHRGRLVHAADTMLLIGPDGPRPLPHAPEYLSRHPSAQPYRQYALCPRFLKELVEPLLEPEDVDLVQRFFGACLLHHNAAQQLLIIRGPGDAGKGALVEVLQKVVGQANCRALRTEHLAKQFEIGQCARFSLLNGPDVDDDFLEAESINVLKSMVGHDLLACEKKHGGTYNRRGTWNIVITSNHRLRVNLKGEVGSWRRRIMIVDAKPKGDRKPIPGFSDVLLAEEGPGILAWMVEGAVRHVRELEAAGRFMLTPAQLERVEGLLAESDSARLFARDCLAKSPGMQVTARDALAAYQDYLDGRGWEHPSERRSGAAIEAAIRDVHGIRQSHDIKPAEGGKAGRGWRNLTLSTPDKQDLPF